jgi:uncharacterized protein (TIGR03032 family)
MNKPASSTPPAPAAAKDSAVESREGQDNNSEDEEKIDPTVNFSLSQGLLPLMEKLNISIALTSYQFSKFFLLGRGPNRRMMVFQRLYPKAMGLCVKDTTIVMGTLFQIARFENILDKGQGVNNIHDACYIPRVMYTTGELDAHDIGLLPNNDIIFVNTRYNCIATTSPRHSFTPVWKPPFISEIVGEDRCHLNGMAMQDGKPKYVTIVANTDTKGGWREQRSGGGMLMDVATNEVVASGFSMPHSPRIHNGQVWMLNSGDGFLGTVDVKNGKFTPVAPLPGFARGLYFYGDYAFVGLSKPRHGRFDGLPLDAKVSPEDAWCGIHVIDLKTGKLAEWFKIDGGMREIYDVAILPGVKCPMSLGFAAKDDLKGLVTFGGIDPTALKG